MTTFTAHAAGDNACDLPDLYKPSFPSATLKCRGRALYRSQEASDYACLLELDPDVTAWRCITQPFFNEPSARTPLLRYVDFAVERAEEYLLVDVWRGPPETNTWLPGVAERLGYTYQPISISDIDPIRIRNARDLVRCGGKEVGLGDRVRILAGLDEMGSLSLAECLGAVREGDPMASIANMIIRGMLEVDLDEKLLEPDTIVRRART